MLGPGVTLDPEVIRNAAAAVLHYFKAELGRHSVSVVEFTAALRQALQRLGFTVREPAPSPSPTAPHHNTPAEVDLSRLQEVARGGELEFFQSLRTDLFERLRSEPGMIVYRGLRGCAKGLCSARRWNDRCQQASDQIVDYLRDCLRLQTQEGNRCVICVL
ncbi:MAG TPA: hypothetical protein DCM86_17730 [Verrucomicrobiales bacterium]|nr:hypothetical protein [Verrucomicrobiales bacterium]